MQQLYFALSRKSPLELFFKGWITATVVLAAYIAVTASMISDISTSLWLIGAPIAFAKAALVVSGLGFLIWFVALRRS